MTPSLTAAERSRLEAIEGIVFDIQRYSVHDGPGLRTNVFLKGCPLRCGWCANPETQALPPEMALFEHNCLTCGQFDTPCPACWSHRATPSAMVARVRSPVLSEVEGETGPSC